MNELTLDPQDVTINGKLLIFEKKKSAIDKTIEKMESDPVFIQLAELSKIIDSTIILDIDEFDFEEK